MGKPGPKQVPVTAKIQKSTVGGVVQPSISGMGSIATMKVKQPSVGKIDRTARTAAARKAYEAKNANKAPKPRMGRAQTRARNLAKGATDKGAEFAAKGAAARGAEFAAKGAAARGAEYGAQSKDNIYIGTGRGLGKTTQEEKAAKSSKKVTSNTNAGNAKSVRGGFFGTDDYKKSVSAGNKEANSDNARRDFTANLKNQTKTKPKVKPKVKTLKAIKTKGVEKVSAKPKAPKLAATSVKPKAVKPTKKQVKESKSVKRKTARAAKTRRKGIEALESGNLAKAKRLNRREARINKRIEKKKSGQASKAIKPE